MMGESGENLVSHFMIRYDKIAVGYGRFAFRIAGTREKIGMLPVCLSLTAVTLLKKIMTSHRNEN